MRVKEPIIKGKKKLLELLQQRYATVELPDKSISLYDATKDSCSKTPARVFVANITINKTKTAFVYNGHMYHSVEKLEDAIEKYIKTLPYGYWNYNPSFSKSWFVQSCIDEYLTSLGFKKNNKDVYEILGIYGETVCSLEVNIDRTINATSGTITKTLDILHWIQGKFGNLEEAIGCINSLILTECLTKMSMLSNLLDGVNSNRKEIEEIDIDPAMGIKKKDMKNKLIARLKEELAKLESE